VVLGGDKMKDPNSLYIQLAADFKQKLARELSKEEKEFLKWLAKKVAEQKDSSS